MPSVDVTKTSEALAVSGGYVIVVGLVSFFIKEKLFVGELFGNYWHDHVIVD